MSQAVNGSRVNKVQLATIYGPIRDELQQVEEMLRRELRSRYPYVDEMVRYGCLLGGKRLRPTLLLLSAQAVGETTADHILLATIVEMIHTATLVHDDVLDNAQMRRHLRTVNDRWDTEASVLLGDFLFSHAFYLASTIGTAEACETIGRSTNIVCEGEMRQKGTCGRVDVDEATYLSILDAKTAELCACSCHLGARFAGGDAARCQQLSQYGRDLGLAFQIVDDLLDVAGEEQTVGKSLGTDLQQLKPTMPLIHVFNALPAKQRKELQYRLQAAPRNRDEILGPYFEKFDALSYTRLQAERYADRARGQLDGLPASAALDVLRTLPDFVVSRTH